MARVPSTISMGYATALMKAAGVPTEHVSLFLRELGLPTHPRSRLTEQQFSTLYRKLVLLLGDEMLGLFCRPAWPGALKYTCLSLLDAKNLKVALHRWSFLSRLLQDNFYFEHTMVDGAARIGLVPVTENAPYKPFAIDLTLKLIHGMASWLTRQHLPLIRVDLPFARPDFFADYEVLYPGPVFFNQAQPALVMDAKLLSLPLRRPRSDLDEFLQHAPGNWVFANLRRPRLRHRLCEYLATLDPSQATAESAADALAVSVRTLHRRLVDEGTTFQGVKDDFRRDRALQLLSESDTPIKLISGQLGFDSVASFCRAFRRWTGDTPKAFRVTAS